MVVLFVNYATCFGLLVCYSLHSTQEVENLFLVLSKMKFRGLYNCYMKAVKMPPFMEGNELSRFSDPPGDASLDDLFHPLDKHHGEMAAEASTSASAFHVGKGNASMKNGGRNDLAKELRDTIARKQWEKESEIGQANNGGNLLRLMMGVLKDDVIDIDGLVCIQCEQMSSFF